MSLHPHPKGQYARSGQEGGRGHSQDSWPQLTKTIFHTFWHLAQQWNTKRKGWGVAFFGKVFVFQSKHCLYGALLPRKWLDIACWWEVKNKSILFPLLPHVAFDFVKGCACPLLNCLYLDSRVFHLIFCSCLIKEWSDRVACWAPGSQPRLTHHTSANLVIQNCLAHWKN